MGWVEFDGEKSLTGTKSKHQPSQTKKARYFVRPRIFTRIENADYTRNLKYFNNAIKIVTAKISLKSFGLSFAVIVVKSQLEELSCRFKNVVDATKD